MNLNKTQIVWYGVVQEHAQAKKYQDISRAYRELIPVNKYFLHINENFIVGFSDPCFGRISDPSRENFGRSRKVAKCLVGRAFSRPAPKLRRSPS